MILMDNVIVPEENLLNVQGLKVSLPNELGLTLYNTSLTKNIKHFHKVTFYI